LAVPIFTVYVLACCFLYLTLVYHDLLYVV
jgi:hypothetical protein